MLRSVASLLFLFPYLILMLWSFLSRSEMAASAGWLAAGAAAILGWMLFRIVSQGTSRVVDLRIRDDAFEVRSAGVTTIVHWADVKSGRPEGPFITLRGAAGPLLNLPYRVLRESNQQADVEAWLRNVLGDRWGKGPRSTICVVLLWVALIVSLVFVYTLVRNRG